ncbi:tetratricopeptide repeat protein [Bacteroidales bacterium OttesenSCG-928-B11]|nr:tetratricopeptide repeat protein [Bacteroidales bacterium OttesenSCG-928-E04]MDL2312541.1 tetratricopeptide repeat protein [Bacteroidales bacterium OttesenSCG-928-B11]MDL2326498.1 tetratricopeptide repeat protein [Bacteroidales bacterium OttesenSCG-928-A14]
MGNKQKNQANLNPAFIESEKFQSLKEGNLMWKWAFWGIALIGLIAIIILSLDAGNSGDEHFHLEQAENVYNYYTTFGKDSTAAVVTEKYNLPYYGQSVDNFAYFVSKIFNVDDTYAARHIINSLFGWLAMLFVGLIAYRIAGWRAAVIAFTLIFLSPRFLGHSFNNLKDLPMATGISFGLYCLIRFLQEFPKIKWKTAILLGIAIGFAISVRVAGLLLIAYFGMFGLIYWIIRNKKNGLFSKASKQEFLKMLAWGAGISVAGFILAILLWPFLLKAPIANAMDTLSSMSKFATAIRQLFEGSLQWSDVLPWYYTPKFILMTIPIAVIVGALLYLVLLWKKKEDYFWSFLIFFTFFFPVFWIIYQKSNVYGGWRHAMFIYPSLVVFAALGFESLIGIIKNRYLKIAATALPFLLLIMPLTHVIKNHPYEYVYFNELSGGMDKAYGNYEMDYYYHSTREATEWVIENAEKSGLETGDKIRVASWHTASVGYFLRNDTARFQNTFSRWLERGNNDWDYAIFVITGMMPEQIKGEHFPPKNSVHEITVDGKPICFVLKREDKSDLIGNNFKKANEKDSAIYYLEKSFAYDNYNETVIQNLIELYFMSGRVDDAKKMLDHGLAYLPKSETMNYFLAHYYMNIGNLDEAINTCEKIIEYNFKFGGAYHLACNCYLRKNDLKGAEKMLLRLVDVDMLDEQGMKQLMEIYKSQGMTEPLAIKRIYTTIAKSLEKRGKKEEAATYREYARGIR